MCTAVKIKQEWLEKVVDLQGHFVGFKQPLPSLLFSLLHHALTVTVAQHQAVNWIRELMQTLKRNKLRRIVDGEKK